MTLATSVSRVNAVLTACLERSELLVQPVTLALEVQQVLLGQLGPRVDKEISVLLVWWVHRARLGLKVKQEVPGPRAPMDNLGIKDNLERLGTLEGLVRLEWLEGLVFRDRLVPQDCLETLDIQVHLDRED